MTIADVRTNIIYAEEFMEKARGFLERISSPTAAPNVQAWHPPVGDSAYPPSDWYTYTTHDLTGRLNPGGYRHTGLDFNAKWGGRGNVDIGEPVFCVADAEVVDTGWSQKYRGGIVVKVDHYGIPLWIRYWHLQRTMLGNFPIGTRVTQGQIIGLIDEYPLDFAHLHWDTSYTPIKHNWWWTYHKDAAWSDSKHILRMHLDHELVEAMTGRK